MTLRVTLSDKPHWTFSDLPESYVMYRYGPGQCFGKHVDDFVELANGQHTEYTLLIYLTGSGKPAQQTKQKSATKHSSELSGGETIFYGKNLSFLSAKLCPWAF